MDRCLGCLNWTSKSVQVLFNGARVLDVPAAPMTSPSASDSSQLRLLTLTQTARQRAEAAIERERSRSRRPPVPVRTSMTAINLETKATFPVPEGLYQHISRMSRTPDVPAADLAPGKAMPVPMAAAPAMTAPAMTPGPMPPPPVTTMPVGPASSSGDAPIPGIWYRSSHSTDFDSSEICHLLRNSF